MGFEVLVCTMDRVRGIETSKDDEGGVRLGSGEKKVE